MTYLEAYGVDELSARRAELAGLTTPAPANEAAQNRLRMSTATALRQHITALEELMYPPDEDLIEGDADA